MRSLEDGAIVIAGAGSIGLFVGGALALAGKKVRFLGRERLRAEIAEHGLRITDLDGFDQSLDPNAVEVLTDPAEAFAGARIVLVCVKSGATEEMARLIAAHAPEDAIIVSLQNGVDNPDTLRAQAAGRPVIPGMVPYNVVQLGEGRVHRGTTGATKIGADVPGLGEFLNAPSSAVREEPEIEAVQWGKLLLNLNNALNALSDLPLKTQIENAAWRRLFGDVIAEGLGLLRAAGIQPKPATGKIPTALIPHVMRLPNSLFQLLAGAMVRIDPNARSSMWEDLKLGRPTEVDALQGAILRLAERLGRRAPIAERVVAEIRKAEAAGAGSPGLSPQTLRG